MQIGVAAGHCEALLAVQSTHLPELVLHTSLDEHWLSSRDPHSSHVPSLWQAGAAALRALHAVSPAALLVHSSHVCVLVSQMGADAGQFALVRHATQVWLAVSQNLPGSSLHWALSVHCTHRPLASSQVVLV